MTKPEVLELQVNMQQANLILNALGDCPWKLSNDLILNLQKQLMEQINNPGAPRQEEMTLSR